jgi:hypothetical protein
MAQIAFRSLDPSSDLGKRAAQSAFFVRAREKARRARLGGHDFYVVEGDLLLDEVQLAEYALRRDAGGDVEVVEAEVDGKRSKLLGISHDGKLLRWRPGKVLSFYVEKETFPDEATYKTARESVRTATEDWMKVCGVEFAYRGDLDANAALRTGDTVFSVVFQDVNGAFIAAAFFPDDPPARRVVVIDPSFFRPALPFDRVGVLRHELGHVLGFRHEHIRSEAPPGCPGESLFDTEPLTSDYDPRSVMHYFCGGVGDTSLSITTLDIEGSRRLYGLPLSAYSMAD